MKRERRKWINVFNRLFKFSINYTMLDDKSLLEIVLFNYSTWLNLIINRTVMKKVYSVFWITLWRLAYDKIKLCTGTRTVTILVLSSKIMIWHRYNSYEQLMQSLVTINRFVRNNLLPRMSSWQWYMIYALCDN